MSTLLLVRHGQAAAFSDDSDRLTELGQRQSRILGDYLAARGEHFDEVITGELTRQVQTEAQVAAAYRDAGVPWPQVRRDPGWDEYEAGAILTQLAPLLAEQDPDFARAVADFQEHRQASDRNRYFQRMLEQVMDAWIGGRVLAEGVQSFADYHARVMAARERILAGPPSRRVAVFSSGGCIGVCVQATLQAPEPVALRINWRVKNASLTEFTFSRGRISLDSFNGLPHLDDPDLQSFR